MQCGCEVGTGVCCLLCMLAAQNHTCDTNIWAIFLPLFEVEGSVLCSQKLSADSCPDRDQSLPRTSFPNIFTFNSYINSPFTVWCCKFSLSSRVFRPNNCMSHIFKACYMRRQSSQHYCMVKDASARSLWRVPSSAAQSVWRMMWLLVWFSAGHWGPTLLVPRGGGLFPGTKYDVSHSRPPGVEVYNLWSYPPCLYGMHSGTLYFTARTVWTRVRIPLHVGVYVNVYAGDGQMYVETLHVASPVLQKSCHC